MPKEQNMLQSESSQTDYRKPVDGLLEREHREHKLYDTEESWKQCANGQESIQLN